MEERLQKLLSACGAASRREAEDLIKRGLVKVNGKTAVLGQKADIEKDDIELDGKPLKTRVTRVYIMLNKPAGYVTTMRDDRNRRTVLDLVEDCGERVYPVGRLDLNSEGLLFMTNDGDLANRIMHPSGEADKTYHTWINGDNLEKAVEIMSKEMVIDGYKIRPAKVRIIRKSPGGSLLSITIHEGRNRQVRKMCAQAGLSVRRLKRVSEAGISLGDLKSGKWRYLTEDEIRRLQSL